MAIVAGIDEAGYGPVLGPLVVTGVAFEVPDEQADCCLWKALSTSICRRVFKKSRRLPILDSKKLYKSGCGLAALERSALVMLASARPLPGTLSELLEQIAPHVLEPMRDYPWYDGLDHPMPLEVDPGAIAAQANAVRRNARSAGVRLTGVLSEPLLEGQYNRMVQSTRNKASVLTSLTLRIIDRILRKADGQPVRLFVDRQGGRLRYVDTLLRSFDGYELEVLEEAPDRSCYRLSRPPCSHIVEFRANGEDHHLPVALASIYSKYLRELFMRGLNRFWSGHVVSLRPTAGYYTDGRRFIDDISGTVERLGVDRGMLVRLR